MNAQPLRWHCKLTQHTITTQLLLLTTLMAYAQATNVLFATKSGELAIQQTKFKTKPNGPDSAFKLCYNGKCQCKKDLMNCYVSDRSGAVTLDIAMERKQDQITISCEGAPSDVDQLLADITYNSNNQVVYFKMRNCLHLPAILQRKNTTYMANIEYGAEGGHFVPEDLLHETKGLTRLIFNITTHSLAYAMSPKLFRTLSHLQELELVVVCNAAEIAVPLDIFHGIYDLQRLSLFVYHTEMGYYELQSSQHTSARNLTSAHFRDLGALKSLLLDANHLGTLKATMFSTLPALNVLGLSLNDLKVLPAELLAKQAKLVVLDLSLNALNSLPVGIFRNTPLLWKLLLSNNQFNTPTNIIAALRPLRYLHTLDLTNNHLRTLWGSGNYSAQNLLTRHNIRDPSELVEFADYVRSSRPDLRIPILNPTLIGLRNNRIDHFNLDWIAIAGLACPYELDLLHNNIQHMYASTQPASPTTQCMRRLKLQFNPLHCDCTLAWIYSSNLLARGDHWTCASPAHLRDRKLNQLQRMDLCAWTPAFCPPRCSCAYDMHTMLVVNCTGAGLEVITQLPRPEQFSVKQTTLHLERNNFYELPVNTTFGYANVTHIYAAHNRLTVILASHIPSGNLALLDVRHNRLERLSAEFLQIYLNESNTLTHLYLSANPWICDCEAELLLYTLHAQRSRIPDAHELRCANLPPGMALLNVSFAEVCKPPFLLTSNLLPPLIALFATAVCLLSIVALFYKYKFDVKIWLFAHEMCLCCINERELDKEKSFDAFISYAHQDQAYVNDTLVPGLETGRPAFRICTHERNWLAGAFIPEQIVESVAQSRRTIIVLSQHFVASDWARMEFRTAHQCALNEGRTRIIVIKYGELTNWECVDTELQAYLKLNTYLEWNDARFWQKLRYAMPHKFDERRKSGMLQLEPMR